MVWEVWGSLGSGEVGVGSGGFGEDWGDPGVVWGGPVEFGEVWVGYGRCESRLGNGLEEVWGGPEVFG